MVPQYGYMSTDTRLVIPHGYMYTNTRVLYYMSYCHYATVTLTDP